MIVIQLSGNLQGPQKVQPPGVRSGVVRPGQHGNHGRLVHAERRPRRGGNQLDNKQLINTIGY